MEQRDYLWQAMAPARWRSAAGLLFWDARELHRVGPKWDLPEPQGFFQKNRYLGDRPPPEGNSALQGVHPSLEVADRVCSHALGGGNIRAIR